MTEDDMKTHDYEVEILEEQPQLLRFGDLIDGADRVISGTTRVSHGFMVESVVQQGRTRTVVETTGGRIVFQTNARVQIRRVHQR